MERSEFAHLIPHTGRMCLLDQVLTWDTHRIRCRASSHRDRGNPLTESGRLHSVCGVEYAAQAAALHSALVAPAQGIAPTPGYLAAVRRLSIERRRLDDLAEDLIVGAVRELADPGGLVYDFVVMAGERTVLAGRLAILFPT